MSTPTAGLARFADGLERSLWTVAEGAGAVGIYAGYQALPIIDIPDGYRALSIILIGGVLAGIKSAVAQRWGNGTAATLPAELEPRPADEEQVPSTITVSVPSLEDLDPEAVAMLVRKHRSDVAGQIIPQSQVDQDVADAMADALREDPDVADAKPR